MTASKRGAALVALGLCLLAPAPRASAQELLVMPYACTVLGGRPLLSPGPEQSHRILGLREQRKFTACSPVNPGLCRNWSVHRFDLDCDGTRVAWVSVVAAADEMSRRSRLVDGRLQLRMGPSWNLAPDDPCAREPGLDDRFAYGRMRRYCADRLAMAPPAVVEMPPGFAPMLGIDAIIVKAAPGIGTAPPLPPVAAGPPPAKAAGADPQRMELDGIAPPQLEPPRAPVAKEAPAKAAPPASPEVTAATPPKVAAPPDAPKVASRPEAAPSDPPPSPATPPPKTAASDPKPAVEAPKRTAPADAKPAAKIAAAPPKEAAPQPPPPVRPAEVEDNAPAINLLTVFRTTTTGAIVAFAGLALGLLTAFALARRRERVRHAGMRPRDLASVSLGSKRARPPARLGDARGRLPPNAAASAMSRVPGASVPARGALADWGDRMPATRTEALQVLGIGVTPSASEAALKKIVDGLRQSWHPDHARDEADRRLRELRSKQINAAWALLHAQGADA